MSRITQRQKRGSPEPEESFSIPVNRTATKNTLALLALLLTLAACGGDEDSSPVETETLAYIVSSCRQTGAEMTVRQELRVRRGEAEDVTVLSVGPLGPFPSVALWGLGIHPPMVVPGGRGVAAVGDHTGRFGNRLRAHRRVCRSGPRAAPAGATRHLLRAGRRQRPAPPRPGEPLSRHLLCSQRLHLGRHLSRGRPAAGSSSPTLIGGRTRRARTRRRCSCRASRPARAGGR